MMRCWVFSVIFLSVLCAPLARLAAQNTFYDVKIEGVPSAVLGGFENEAQLMRLQNTDFDGVDALRRRADSDAETLKIAMRGDGYFGAEVEIKVDEGKDKPLVSLELIKGAVFKIGGYSLIIEGGDGAGILKARADMRDENNPLPVGKDAEADLVLAPEKKAMLTLMQNGYPVPVAVKRVLLVDKAAQTVDVQIVIDAGPEVRFGATHFKGLKRVRERFLKRRVAWKEGEMFDVRLVETTRKRLLATGVISGSEIIYDPRGSVFMPMEIDVREAKMRSIGAGGAYSTSQGVEGKVFWEHRNLFGAAEKLRITLEGGWDTQGLSFVFSKPDMFGSSNVTLKNKLNIGNEDHEAYKKRTVSSLNTLAWKITPYFELSGGVGVEQSQITPKGLGVKNNFTLMSLPVMGWLDTSDNALDPHSGSKISGGITPYYALNKGLNFYILDVSAAHYWGISERLVWANRVRIGAITGADIADIPADKRLYSGGSGSVRGYGYQKLGPVGADGKPTGGKSLMEVSTEMRADIVGDIGGVVFVEGGSVSTGTDEMKAFRWGGGVGLRYKTVAGPIRFDVAVPFDKRKSDSAYQIYIGLGQAF